MNDTYVELLVKKPELKAASWLHNIMIGLGAVLFLIGLSDYHIRTAALWRGISAAAECKYRI